MSKEKRQKRFQQKNRHISRQMDIWFDTIGRRYITEPIEQPHRFHKRHALNCGDPKCVMCGNPRKFFGELTIQERKFYTEEIENV